MKRAALILLILIAAVRVRAAPPTDAELARVDFQQNVGAFVSPSLSFIDDHGHPVRMGDYFGKPSVLVLGYSRCPMLCTVVLNGLISALQDLKPSPGGAFDVIFVSIDPTETTALASSKKANYVKFYGRPGTAAGWHFLTGSKSSIDALAKEVGYGYVYDPATQQYAHPSGLTILAANGKIVRYFFGVTYPSTELADALRDADQNRSESAVHQFVYLCFHYNPIRGKYGHLIMALLRGGAVATVIAMGGFLALNRHSEAEAKEAR